MSIIECAHWGIDSERVPFTVPIAKDGIGAAYRWSPISPSGGGCFTTTKVSPHDDQIIHANNDMFGTYRSVNGGRSWEDLSAKYHFRVVYCWAYHPVAKGKVFAGATTGFLRSSDGGESWDRIEYPRGFDCEHGPHCVVFDCMRPNIGIAVVLNMSAGSGGAVLSTQDGGDTWAVVSELNSEIGSVRGVVFDERRSGVVVICGVDGLARSSDGGNTWESVGRDVVSTYGEIQYFSGGSDGKATYLYVTVATKYDDGEFDGGVLVSCDAGASWEKAGLDGLETFKKKEYIRGGDLQKEYEPSYTWIAACQTQPNVVYVGMDRNCAYDLLDPTGTGRDTVFRSRDAGKTWKKILWQHPDMKDHNVVNHSWVAGQWGWQTGPTYLSVCETDPEVVLHSNWNSLLLTRDGGGKWIYLTGQIPNNGAAENTVVDKRNEQLDAGGDERTCEVYPSSIGSMLTINGYHVSPHDSNFHYMSVTDFPGWFSRDAGKNWEFSVKGLVYPHDMYAVEFDPEVPGRLWGCVSRRHDIPHWKFVLPADSDDPIYHGAIVRSDDNGLSWYQVNEAGLPVATATDLYLDPDSSVENRCLWAAVIGCGLYRSLDGGVTWECRNNGLDIDTNNKVLRINRGPDGRLYCLKTVGAWDRENQSLVSGGLYVSSDDGGAWELLSNQEEMLYPVRFSFDPVNAGTIYVACLDASFEAQEAIGDRCLGGLWRTVDGGGNWSKIFSDTCFDVTVHPANSAEIYVSTCGENLTNGLYLSNDRGESWEIMDCPAKRTQDIVFDPHNPNTLYVSTWGSGAWRGDRIG